MTKRWLHYFKYLLICSYIQPAPEYVRTCVYYYNVFNRDFMLARKAVERRVPKCVFEVTSSKGFIDAILFRWPLHNISYRDDHEYVWIGIAIIPYSSIVRSSNYWIRCITELQRGTCALLPHATIEGHNLL